MLSSSLLLLSLTVLAASGAPEQRFSCEECVREMHGLGFLIREAATDIEAYLAAKLLPHSGGSPL